MRALLLSLLTGTIVVSACKSSSSSGADASAASSASVSADAAPPEERRRDDGVHPVYPVDVKPDPVAAKLCEALHGMPEKVRSTCCSETPGFTLASECTRVVSGALQFKAVTLALADVDKCVSEIEKVYSGCDWVGSHKIIPPESCEGILKGTLQQGARCRSSVECVEGLRCAGVGPTDAGRCAPAGEDGMPCGGSVDVLERYTRQQDSEKKHPVCTGICDRHRCIPPPAVGAPCQASISCGPGKVCVKAKCAVARVQKLGEPCFDGECDKGLYCIKEKCVGPQPAGADCSTEFECMAACLLPDGGTKGKCGKRCVIR
jgi:hypothetical protein